MSDYSVVILGGGPGGYVAAIRAAQLGHKVAVVESTHLGGICLNWGCIPTKALLKNAEVLTTIRNAGKFGVDIPDFSVNWSKVVKRSRDVSLRLTRGVEFLFKKNKIDWIRARGELLDAKTLRTVTAEGEQRDIRGKYIIIATGARPNYFPGMKPDGEYITTSKEAMILKAVPKSLIIVGAGAIGVEFAHIYNTFGAAVTLVEALPRILPVEDEEISAELTRIFKKRKIGLKTAAKVEKIETGTEGVTVRLQSGDTIQAEKALIAVGVRGNIEKIGLEKLKIATAKGWITTDSYLQTNIENVYAIGDVVGPPWLAHVASAEGITAVEHLSGKNPPPMSYDNVPGCTYCQPEVASVGLTEAQAKSAGHEVKIGKFPYRALGKAMASGDTEGFVKMIYDAKYGELLGCHIIGPEATNLIMEAGIARKLETTHFDLLKTIHPHPTLSEALMEATADALGEAIHI